MIKTLNEDKYQNSSKLTTIIKSEFRFAFISHKAIVLYWKSIQTSQILVNI